MADWAIYLPNWGLYEWVRIGDKTVGRDPQRVIKTIGASISLRNTCGRTRTVYKRDVGHGETLCSKKESHRVANAYPILRKCVDRPNPSPLDG